MGDFGGDRSKICSDIWEIIRMGLEVGGGWVDIILSETT